MASNYTLSLRLSRKEFAHRTGVTFRGLTISQTEKGYNAIVRAFKRDGTPVYCLVQHECPVTAVEILGRLVMGRGGAQMWHKDKYYRNGAGR